MSLYKLLLLFENKTRPLTLTNVCLGMLCAILFKKTKNPLINTNWNGYTLVREIPSFGTTKFYTLGIYEKDGKTYFLKFWNGIVKDLAYYTFKNELAIYKAFESISLDNFTPNIQIPKLFDVYQDDSCLCGIFECIELNDISLLPVEDKTQIYMKTLEFIQKSFEKMSIESRRPISVRSNTSYIFMYPLVLVKALFISRKNSVLLFKGISYYFKCFPLFFDNSALGLIHKDLNFRNILGNLRELYLIDFQYMCIADPYLEYASTLRSHISEMDFALELIKHVYTNASIENRIKFVFFCVFYSTLGLTDPSFTQQRKDDFSKVLTFIYEVAKI